MFKPIVRLFCTRGIKRRQDILTLLAGHPDHEYRVTEICMMLRSWSGVVGPDLLKLHRRRKINRRRDETGVYVYQFRSNKEAAL